MNEAKSADSKPEEIREKRRCSQHQSDVQILLDRPLIPGTEHSLSFCDLNDERLFRAFYIYISNSVRSELKIDRLIRAPIMVRGFCYPAIDGEKQAAQNEREKHILQSIDREGQRSRVFSPDGEQFRPQLFLYCGPGN